MFPTLSESPASSAVTPLVLNPISVDGDRHACFSQLEEEEADDDDDDD